MIDLTAVRLERPRLAAPLLDGADLQVGRGEVVLITGSSGAGTSTLVDAVLGEVAPAVGHVAVFGRDLARLRRSSLLALRRRLGVIPQRLELLPERSAIANVALPLEIDHVPRSEIAVRAALCLGRVGLATEIDCRVGDLSLAQQQRVAVARALVRAPSLVIADQPTCHQDVAGTEVIASLLEDAASEGAAVMVVTRDPHLLASAARRGWRQYSVEDGHLVESGVVRGPDSVVDSVPIDLVTEAMIEDSARLITDDGEPRDVTDPGDRPATATTGVNSTVVDAQAPPGAIVPKVLPFPVTARTRGVG
jgi:putative ABC transport system ATP-binding protein